MNYKNIKEVFNDVQNDKLYGANIYLVVEFLLFLSLMMVTTIWLQIIIFLLLMCCSILSIASSFNMYSVIKTTKEKQSAMLNMIDFRERHYGLNYHLFNYIRLFFYKIGYSIIYSVGFLIIGLFFKQETVTQQLFYSLFLLSFILHWMSYGFVNLIYYNDSTKKYKYILKESKRMIWKYKIDLLRSFSTLIVPFILASLLSIGMIFVLYILMKGENYNMIVLFSEFFCMVPLFLKSRYLFVYNFDEIYGKEVTNG